MNEKINLGDSAAAGLIARPGIEEALGLGGVYHVDCRRALPQHKAAYELLFNQRLTAEKWAHRLRWVKPIARRLRTQVDDLVSQMMPMTYSAWDAEAVAPNLVTTVGKNLALDTIFAGSSYTASVAMGLKGTGTAAVGDTMSSHAGWLEVGGANAPTYTAPRKTPAWSAASSGSKVMSAAASFAITGSGTVDGCFMVLGGSTTIDNTTGTLYSAGTFSSPGARVVANLDTLNVTYTGTA
jgi:hypothetical protein